MPATNSAEIISSTPVFNPKQPEQATRVYLFGTNLYQPYNVLDPKSGSELKKYVRLSKNPIVKTALDLRISGTFWNDPVIQSRATDEYAELDKKIIESINRQIKNIPSWNTILQSIYRNALTFGVGIAEKNFLETDDEIVIESIKIKPSYQFDFYTNESDDIESMYHIDSSRYVDPRKFVIATWPYQEMGNYYGISILQSLAHDINLLEKIEEAEAKGVTQIMVKPLIVWSEGGNKSDQDKLEFANALKNLDSGDVLLLNKLEESDGKVYKGEEVQVLDSRAEVDALEDIQDIKANLINRIMRSIGIPDNLGMSETDSGSQAKAREEFNLYNASINSGITFVQDFVNTQIIPDMVQWNYVLPDGYELPELKFAEVEEEYSIDKMEYYKIAIETGILVLENDRDYIREQMGFPPLQKESIDAGVNYA